MRSADSSARPLAVEARAAPPRVSVSNYPEPFASRMARRQKRPLGDLFGLKAFGVNLTRLSPGGQSALHHRHTLQDEFVYVLEGEPTLISDGEEVTLRPGECAGFPANGPAHHLENRTDRDVLFLEVGNRPAGDQVSYPNDDLQATMGGDGKWRIVHKDGTPY
jgi:uncharacterized cupin superfamily protein